MEQFKQIYRILSILRKAMDLEEWDSKLLSPEELGISLPMWSRLMAMLLKEGYITGGEVWESFDVSYPKVKLVRPEITLKGLEYLEENSLMKKAGEMLKEVIHIVK
nr:MAG TPA: YjcQ protein [Caudoviricetes sp.]